MTTIKDIAKAAGVSQGTVSNVLNGKGNVSSRKIHLVQETAKRLGYALNQRAQVLRKGSSKTLAVVVPDLYNRQYVDFYISFINYAQEQGYQVNLYLSGDSPQTERQIIGQIHSNITAGAAVFTSLVTGDDAYQSAGLEKVLYVERSPGFPCSMIGFDMAKIGSDLAELVLRQGYRNVALLTENPAFSSQKQFCESFQSVLRGTDIALNVYHTDEVRCPNDVFQIMEVSPIPEVIIVTNYAFAITVNNIRKHFCPNDDMRIYGLSPVFTLPGGEFEKYELNYRLMGKTTAQMLIGSLHGMEMTPDVRLLPGDGLRGWLPPAVGKRVDKLTIVTLESPSARILKDISQLYTKATGIEINVAIYSYDGLNEMLANVENTDSFDVIRIDSRRLSWYAEKAFEPLEEIDPSIGSVFGTFLPGLSQEYSRYKDILYALPSTPSSQILFYRKDLFENTAWRRQYAEHYQQELLPPSNYMEYNRIARFFTRKINPLSPVPYGTTITLGNSNVAGKEYLTRYFSHSCYLYDEGHIQLTSPQGILAMKELLETKEFIGSNPCSTWQIAASEFAKGNVAMTVMFSNFASAIVGTDSRVLDKIGYALVPGGNPMTGGSAIGVCRYSKRKEEALRFIRWLCTEEVATAMTLMGTMSPCRKTYENYEVMDLYPWLLMAKDNFALSHTRYAPEDGGYPFDEPKFLGILGMAVHTAYHGIMMPEDALRFAQSTFEKTYACHKG